MFRASSACMRIDHDGTIFPRTQTTAFEEGALGHDCMTSASVKIYWQDQVADQISVS